MYSSHVFLKIFNMRKGNWKLSQIGIMSPTPCWNIQGWVRSLVCSDLFLALCLPDVLYQLPCEALYGVQRHGLTQITSTLQVKNHIQITHISLVEKSKWSGNSRGESVNTYWKDSFILNLFIETCYVASSVLGCKKKKMQSQQEGSGFRSFNSMWTPD